MEQKCNWDLKKCDKREKSGGEAVFIKTSIKHFLWFIVVVLRLVKLPNLEKDKSIEITNKHNHWETLNM